ncbi:MAG: hypothetical protein CUN51_06665 [Candidatus Thermofonsia Clade 1 bacterium]|uniref:Uncharacterized protein n=1 Tax=Candidatus Thermofonsia Clade 1 bacterium TaxID=2364210 RepID=A0A2M8NZY6_9CHLR|nr:MAG: hypothetical protein CUN51_06665 [Candidatus Thermofonsia Clade 1 bacterium]
MPNILQLWQISPEELTEIIDENPSLRGFLIGYISEYKLRHLIKSHPDVQSIHKPDDHDRSVKGNLIVQYRGHTFILEVKSLQKNSIYLSGDRLFGTVQVDASDKRTVRFA